MNTELLIKTFIAFCLGAIIYKIILDRCSCDVVEGQFFSNIINRVENEAKDVGRSVGIGRSISKDAAAKAAAAAAKAAAAKASGTPVTDTSKTDTSKTDENNNSASGEMDNAIKGINTDLDSNRESLKILTDNFISEVTEMNNNLNSLGYNLPNESDLPKDLSNITTFTDIAEYPDVLDYLELLLNNMANVKDPLDLIGGEGKKDGYCEGGKDHIEFIIMLLLVNYKLVNKVNKNKFLKIFNRISRYFPDIIENIQKINLDCPAESDKNIKSNTFNNTFHKLFKNNTTNINLGSSLSTIIKQLKDMPTIYGVVIILCITFIFAKFLGLFSMKIDI